MELIYNGLYIVSKGLKYFHVHSGKHNSITYDKRKSLVEVIFQEDLNSQEIAKALGIESVGEPQKVSSMGYPKKFEEVFVTLNGFKLKKLTYDPYEFRILIVSDSESRVVQDYMHTTLVVSEKDQNNPEFWKYIFYSGGLLYLVPVELGRKFTGWDCSNFPSIVVTNKSITLESTSKTVYSLKNKYDRYLIRSIDYQEQFFAEIGKILDNYGIELARYNREKTLSRTAYVSYRISQTPSNALHPGYRDDLANILSKKVPVDFEFRCENAQMFYDFKNKFNNVDLLTNFCEFKTTDKYGTRWTAAIKWGRISEDFNHTYEMDNNSNFSYQCSFNCELYFYEVYDKTAELVEKIYLELYGTDNHGYRETEADEEIIT